MNALRTALLLSLTLFVAPARGAVPNLASLPELRAALSNHLAAPRFDGAMWGVKVVSLDSGKTLFEHNADKLFSPASNSKLLTVALAFDRLGCDQRLRTSFYARAAPSRSGVVVGDLVVFGRGDPGFRSELWSNDVFRALQPLAAALTNAGLRRVRGALVADESFLKGSPYGSGWAWDDLQEYYGAPISALTLDDNCATLRIRPGAQPGDPVRCEVTPPGSGLHIASLATTGPAGTTNTLHLERLPGEHVVRVLGQLPAGTNFVSFQPPVPDPARRFGELLKTTLVLNGIRVDGPVKTANWLDRQVNPLDLNSWVEIASVESAPLDRRAAWILKPSQNLQTDLLLAYLGSLALATNQTRPFETSEDAGIRELQRFLPAAGIAPGEVLFEEGSGLSRNNLVTPNALVRLLEFMSRHRCAEAWREALPVAGVDGTLRRRFVGTPAAGNVRAKTGTLRWANSLSGYLTTASGEKLAFSIMLNRYASPSPDRPGRSEIDDLVRMLVGYQGKSGQDSGSAGLRQRPT